MASLNHVSIRDKEYGWVHITPEDASRLFPNETVSSSDHVFICELCGQYVAFTREGKKTRYFCHSRGEEIKDCDERAEQYNHYPTIQYDGQFDFPLKLLLESETFSLSIGIPQGAFQENDFSVSIKGTASHFFNMKERKQETGITWLPLQQDISIQYHIETHDKVLLNWPDHIPGINPMGTMFDSRGNKILHAEDEVTVGNNYYLITDRCICESFPDVNIVELMHCSIVNSVWRVYEVQAVSFSPDSARFFILYKLHLVKKPTDLHIIWPMTVEEGSISYHNADNLYIAYNGEDQISLQLMPCSAQSAQKEMSGYFQVQSNGFQQMVAFKWHNGQRNCSNHLMVWKNKVIDKILIPDSYGGAADYRVILSNGLDQLKAKKDAHPELYQIPNGVTTKSKSLLDALYEEGIIPTYSFPKNVVSTYISDNKGHTQYQVERGLDVAIGEYAPGRAIVVDKATYQIGGFYYPGSERRKDTRTRPARAFIDDENYKKRVVSCDECGWFGLREDDIKVCPFCGNRSLTESLPMLRPWGFAPKDAKEIPVADLDEQYSYVQQPLYSTLPESETMENVAGYKSLRMASRTNQRIIMVNKGVGGKGFMVCPDCGAAMPGDDPSVLEKVDRPYITVPKFKCSHRDAENLNLGYDFVTDMLVLEISLDPNKVETDREDNLWVNRAGQSLAETIRLVVSRILDVEFTELMTGYRVRKNQTGAYIDVYIYDSLSSGAGYAVAVASVMPEVLERAEALLKGCDCENACYNCLKHYRNQNVHGMLDRFAALDLLNWAKDNSLAPMLSIDMQKKLLAPLGNVLKYADIILSANGDELSVKKNLFHKALKIYPAMWKKPEAKDTIYISDACVKYAKPSAVKKIIDGL